MRTRVSWMDNFISPRRNAARFGMNMSFGVPYKLNSGYMLNFWHAPSV
jgi:hypothetical protein